MIGVYLSGTGNTKHCIEKLIYLLDETAQAVPIEGKETVHLLSQHEFIVLAYPVQFSNAPVMVRNFIKDHSELWKNKRVLCVATMGLFSGAVSLVTLLLASMLFWRVTIPGSLPAFLGSWLLTMVSTLSIGLMVGGIARNAKSASVIACLLYFPMLIFSGATLPLEVMPGAMQKVVSIFPLTQGIQLMKATSLGLSTGGLWVPAAVMGAVTVICMGAAVTCFQWE